MFRFVLAAVCGLVLTSTVTAATLYTEEFVSDDALWGKYSAASSVRVAPDYFTTGGPDGVGDSYISSEHTILETTSGQVIFRGQGNFDSSGDNFVGSWDAIGATRLEYWVRHNADVELTLGVRLAGPTNSPAFAILSGTPVAPNIWTKIVVPIDVTSSAGWVYEGAPTGTLATRYNAIINNVANVQIMAVRGSVETGEVVTFDLDGVSLVPEPGSFALAGLGACAGLALVVRRRRATRG
jgi:hypothetical protein